MTQVQRFRWLSQQNSDKTCTPNERGIASIVSDVMLGVRNPAAAQPREMQNGSNVDLRAEGFMIPLKGALCGRSGAWGEQRVA